MGLAVARAFASDFTTKSRLYQGPVPAGQPVESPGLPDDLRPLTCQIIFGLVHSTTNSTAVPHCGREDVTIECQGEAVWFIVARAGQS